MAAASLSLSGNPLFYPDYNRDRAEHELKTIGRPIVRPSSQSGKYAITYFNESGAIVHSLIGVVGVENYNSMRGRFYRQVFFLQGLDRQFESLQELVDFVKAFNELAYTHSTESTNNYNNLNQSEMNNTLSPLRSNVRTLGRGRRYRRRTTNRRRMANRRRTINYRK
jgi:hypothetical protein